MIRDPEGREQRVVNKGPSPRFLFKSAEVVGWEGFRGGMETHRVRKCEKKGETKAVVKRAFELIPSVHAEVYSTWYCLSSNTY